MGRVFDDQLGAIYAHDMKAQGVLANPPATEGPPTGRSLIVVTPDAHRTMNTYLGASAFFCLSDVDRDLVASAQVTFLEGYLFDRPESQEAYWTASGHATDAGRKVALTLSDLFCGSGTRDGFPPLVRQRVDILFANEAEACALWGCTMASRGRAARAEVSVACITPSEKGSVVAAGPETYEVPAHPVEVVDTTGAGDLYAAGSSFGYTSGRPLPECGELGSLAAAEVISHIGARPRSPGLAAGLTPTGATSGGGLTPTGGATSGGGLTPVWGPPSGSPAPTGWGWGSRSRCTSGTAGRCKRAGLGAPHHVDDPAPQPAHL